MPTCSTPGSARALAPFDAWLARQDARPGVLLSDQRPLHQPRHSHAVGRPDGADGLYNVGEVPFRDVFIHPKILDGYGKTMSKSKGNGVDRST